MLRILRSSSVLAILLCCLVAVPATLAGELPDGFRLEPVLTGLTEPSALAFTSDQRILVTERTTGQVRVIAGGQLRPAPLCTVAVNSTGEGGLLGIAVHPQFGQRGWIYLYYTDLATGKNRVTRLTVSGLTCGDPLTILADLGAGAGFLRNGGGLSFGPDGKLYVATGDVQDTTNGQNPAVLPGKILRVNDDGSVPGDNPTGGSYVFARGVRDGRGLVVDGSGRVWAADHGDDLSSAHDELDPVNAGGNLGWAIESGPGGGMDQPLVSWLPTVGVTGVALSGATNYPDLDADGDDNDHDRYGADGWPGKARTDDNQVGVCVGGTNNNNACTTNANCPPRAGENVVFCQLLDDLGEWCPGGVPVYDDACAGATGGIGTDEPDEAFTGNLFTASNELIERAVLNGTTLSVARTFLDSTPGPAITDCPVGWTGLALGRDGWLYAVARNSGGATGGLYRVVHEGEPGPREVSPTRSPFPLQLGKNGNPGEVVLYWEDLRRDSMQPRDNGVDPQPPVRESTLWKGTLGSYYSHAPIAGSSAEPGTAVNGALRSKTVSVTIGANEYFLASGRSANLEGTLGRNSAAAERPGYAVTDLCQTIGYYAPGGPLFRCGLDFSLLDENAISRSLSEYRGRVVMFDLSAEWCAPCHDQANIMQQMYLDYKDRDVVMLTVLMDEWNQTATYTGRPIPTECRDWSDRPGVAPDHTFECWVDPNGGPQPSWNNYGTGFLPTNIFLDSGMRVVTAFAGFSQAALRAELDQLVGTTDTCLP